jgi:hypothetical protein
MGVTARFAPDRFAAQARRALPPADAAALGDPELGRAFARLVYEATHGSPQSAQHDTALMIGPWGFDPAEVQPAVRMWHGTEDRNAPPAMGRHLADRLPRAELTWLEGEGHISAAANRSSEILQALAARAGSAGLGLVVMLVVGFPANINVALNNLQTDLVPGSPVYQWGRLLMQPLLVWFVAWASGLVPRTPRHRAAAGESLGRVGA